MLRTVLLPVLLLALAGTALGAVMGVVWEWLWTPPTGAAWKGEFFLDRDGLTNEFDAGGWFTVIGLVGGIGYGLVAARWCRAMPLVVLGGVVVGAFLQAWAMYSLGHLLGPPDPHAVARTAGDWEPIVSDLRLVGVEHPMRPFTVGSPVLLAPALGALVSLVGIFLGGTKRRRR